MVTDLTLFTPDQYPELLVPKGAVCPQGISPNGSININDCYELKTSASQRFSRSNVQRTELTDVALLKTSWSFPIHFNPVYFSKKKFKGVLKKTQHFNWQQVNVFTMRNITSTSKKPSLQLNHITININIRTSLPQCKCPRYENTSGTMNLFQLT